MDRDVIKDIVIFGVVGLLAMLFAVAVVHEGTHYLQCSLDNRTRPVGYTTLNGTSNNSYIDFGFAVLCQSHISTADKTIDQLNAEWDNVNRDVHDTWELEANIVMLAFYIPFMVCFAIWLGRRRKKRDDNGAS